MIFKELKEYKNKYFDNWIDLIFRFGIPDIDANMECMYGRFYSVRFIWFFDCLDILIR